MEGTRAVTRLGWSPRTTCTTSCLGLGAVAPRGLYDGRFTAWLRAHPVVNAGLTFLLLATALYLGLSSFLPDWLGGVIALPPAAGLAAWVVYRARSVEQTT